MNQRPSHVGSASERWGTEGYIPQFKVLSAKSSGVVLGNVFNVLGYSEGLRHRDSPRFFDQVGHQTSMYLLEISIFSLNHVIVRATTIMNRADKNWAHF